MTTKSEIISKLKLEYPTLKVGSDETGYTELSTKEYETQISEWADNILQASAQAETAAQVEADKAAATAKLKALGLTADDLKALGL